MKKHSIKQKIAIIGLGSYLPKQVLTNADLEKIIDTSDQWITSRTGIQKRHIVLPGQVTSDLALEAAKKAILAATIQPEELTHYIVATLTPDYYCPATAVQVQHKLGIKNRIAFDINAACSGFLYALQVAQALAIMDNQAKILVIGADVLTSRTNWNDRRTCVLFGDGAGAAIVAAPGQYQTIATIDDLILSSNGAYADLLTIKGGGAGRPLYLGEPTTDDFFIQMSGSEIFKLAVRTMSAIAMQIIEKNNITPAEIDIFIPHQANLRIINAVAKRIGFSKKKCFTNVAHCGNTSAASIPIALADAWIEGFIQPNDRVLLTTFGGGATWGAGLLQF